MSERKANRIIGIILLIPPLLGVLLFLLNLVERKIGDIAEMSHLSSEWTGSSGSTGGYTSAAPIYLGLMAIAGAILLSSSASEKRQENNSKDSAEKDSNDSDNESIK